MVTCSPLSDGFGVQAEGVDLSEPLSEASFDALSAAFCRGAVLVLRDQRLTPARVHGFTRRVGVPEPHVIDPFHHPEFADILILSNLRRDGRPIGLADAMERRIDGLPDDDEGPALLETLKAHALQPKYRLSVRYGIGDVVIQDSLPLLHAATLTDPMDPRTLWRITVKPPGGLPA